MTPQQTQAYDQASDHVKELFSSFEAAAFNKKLIEAHAVPEAQINNLLTATGDVILGLASIETLPGSLEKLGIEKEAAGKITNDLLNYIGDASKSSSAAGDIDMQSYMQEEKITPTAPAQPAAAEAAVTPTPPVAATASPVQNVRQTGSLRTMGQDMGRLQQGYAAQPATPAPASSSEDTIVQSLSQDELRGKHAEVPDYSKHE